MKRRYLFLIAVIAMLLIVGMPQKASVERSEYFAGIDDITDPHLKACIMGDDEYSSGIENIKRLVCLEKDIKSTDGIEQLVSLEYLRLQSNSISSIDVSSLVNLTNLDVANNNLTNLDLSNNTALKYLQIASNKISSIDLSHNTDLEAIYANNNTTLNLSANTKLKELRIPGIKNCTLPSPNVIEKIEIDSSQFSDFNFSDFPSLKQLNLSNDKSIAIYGTTLKKSDIFDNVPSFIKLNEYKLYDTYANLREIDSDFNESGIYNGKIGDVYKTYLCAMTYSNLYGDVFDCGNVTISGVPSTVTSQGFRGWYNFYFVNITSDRYEINEANKTIAVGEDSAETILQNINVSWDHCTLKVEGDKLLVTHNNSTIATFTLDRMTSTKVPSPNTDTNITYIIIAGIIVAGLGLYLIRKTSLNY